MRNQLPVSKSPRYWTGKDEFIKSSSFQFDDVCGVAPLAFFWPLNPLLKDRRADKMPVKIEWEKVLHQPGLALKAVTISADFDP